MHKGHETNMTSFIAALGAKCPQSLVKDLSNVLEKAVCIDPLSPDFIEYFKALSVDLYQIAVSRRHLLLNEFKYLLSKKAGYTQGAAATEIFRIAQEHHFCPPGRASLLGKTLLAWSEGTSTAQVWGIKAAMVGLSELGYVPQTSTIKILMAHACDLINETPEYLKKDNSDFLTLVEIVTLGRNIFYNNEF